MALILLLLLLPHPALPAYLHRRFFVYDQETARWSEARRKCQSLHEDLAIYRNVSEYERVKQSHPCDDCWIGIRKNNQEFQWNTGEELTGMYWDSPPDDVTKKCVVQKWGGLEQKECSDEKKYMCYQDDMVLVRENRTWEEALDHCRALDATLPDPIPGTFYDLPPLHEPQFLHTARGKAEEALTPTLWVGLRFMAGEWLWLDGQLHHPQPATCPAERKECGALQRGGDVVTHQRCLDKRNFLCYRRFY